MKKILFYIFVLSVVLPTLALASFDVSLKYGSRGNAVIELQSFLQKQGVFSGKIDGSFGAITRRAVIAFQLANNLKGDGYFGLLSRAKANSLNIKLTDTGKTISSKNIIKPKNSGQEKNYDVVIAGAGTGGISAAIQSAKMGMKVALLEETDWIGGQMGSAGVGSMDGGDLGGSGIYAEFLKKIETYYKNKGKNFSTCYWNPSWHCFEPSVIKMVLNQMINETSFSSGTGSIDLLTRTSVSQVLKNNNLVTGIIVNNGDKINSKILVDATEYGDVIPLTGARYRIGNGTSDNQKPNACIQAITYTAVVKKYPDGVPSNLFMSVPPGPATGEESYDQRKAEFARVISKDGAPHFGPGYPYNFYVHNAYRGMPDSSNSQFDINPIQENITKTSVNFANDYPMIAPYVATTGPMLSIKYIEDKNFRKQESCKAKLKTLQFIYYIQHDLGQPLWSVANDEGYNTQYNSDNACSNIGAEYKEIEKYFPQAPYVRESRRIIGLTTETAKDIKRIIPFSSYYLPNKIDSDSIALGDYGVDLHYCYENQDLENQFENKNDSKGSKRGPFTVSSKTLIPESLDGFLVAEKNISVTRLMGGAIRLQPITMSVGQAAGAMAALSVKNNVQPRDLKIELVQKALVDSNLIISPYIYSDVPQSNIYWKGVQMVSTKEIMVGYGNGTFGVNDSLDRRQAAVVLALTGDLSLDNPDTPSFADVPLGDWGYKHIEALLREGITAGCSLNPKKYCPDDLISRRNFAVLLSGTMKFNTSNVSNIPYFEDVPADSVGFKIIQYMYEKGITAGCSLNSKKYCPEDFITRGQAAAFITEALVSE
ncbi:MAG: FAD-dependent oxidoreductase [Candidatus Paceibacterota bacterium]|jgi:hypothetical protein